MTVGVSSSLLHHRRNTILPTLSKLYTSKNDCSAPTLGGEQDRSSVFYKGPYGEQVHQEMRMICEAVAGGGRDTAWCQDNCQILGGFPPVQRQSCPTAECRCLEYCICNNGTVAEGRDCTGERCPECDESLVFGRCSADGSAAGPLAVTEGHAVLLIDGYPLEERGYTMSVPHNVTVFSGGSSRPMWFLLDVDQGHFETYATDSDKGICRSFCASKHFF